MSRVRAVESWAVALPLVRPVRSAVREATETVTVLVRVRTDDVSGIGFVSAFTRPIARALCHLVDELASVVVGTEALHVDERYDAMQQHLRLIGTLGPSQTAVAALDLALWDLRGKLTDTPVHGLMGSIHEELHVYASDGCWLVPEEQVADEVLAAIKDGFELVKIRAGRPNPSADLQVLDHVRSVAGDGIDIIVDANQGWDLRTAVGIAPRLAELGVVWIEEPLVADDLAGYAEFARTVRLPLALGESLFTSRELAEFAQSTSISLLTPDLQRLGGLTGWRRALAGTRGLVGRVGSHLYPEFAIHLLAAEPRPGPVEWVEWNAPVARAPTQPKNGRLQVPEDPGFGLLYDWDAVAGNAFATGGATRLPVVD